MEIAIALGFMALCGWDVARRFLLGQRKAERVAAELVAAEVATASTVHGEHEQRLAKLERQITDLRGSRVESRQPRLTGIGGRRDG